MCTQMQQQFRCHVEAVPEGRHSVARVLDDIGLSREDHETWDNALLVLAEMLANAVRVCRVGLSVKVEVHQAWLQIEVADDSPAPPVRRKPAPEDAHGRGVDIIAMLSDDWGHRWDGSMKTVWSRMNLSPGVALQVPCGVAMRSVVPAYDYQSDVVGRTGSAEGAAHDPLT